ncbi:MAG: GNAT family N-acetyltransferase [Clostridium sp.]|uniref:GNAT family N-acetyltransferase n=1 Tax=Clostridium sp. TaxID=1506 RepID=UPI002912627D|nr:GNAT family N-acetyltransferase [Clostridium sp.]MDU4939339.1 GNAT family N-acetyltransferase [Clostridium sp.]
MNIRKATKNDLSRIAEIYVFNNRMNYWPIFKDDGFSFGELQVVTMIDHYFEKDEILKNILVYDDGLIKGFIQMKEREICKIYVDTFFQSKGIGKELIEYAINKYEANNLWALEKNERAISFYIKHGFNLTGEKKLEEDTIEYLVHLTR